jgi:hypothetical protein
MTIPLFRHASAPAAASLHCDPAPEAVCFMGHGFLRNLKMRLLKRQ